MIDPRYLLLGLGVLEALAILALGYLAFVAGAIDVVTMALGVLAITAITFPGYVWAFRNGAF